MAGESLLASWSDTRAAITESVESVTTEGHPRFVPAAERIAVFDNDGTLWTEKPIPIQLDFTLHRMAEQAAAEPALADQHDGLRIMLRHDHAERETAYDHGAEDALARAGDRGWTVVSMRNGWTRVFPED